MSTSYFVTYAEPQTFVMNGMERRLFSAPVTGHEHTDLDDARQELQELAARIRQPLKVTRYMSVDDDEHGILAAPFTRSSKEAVPCP